MNEYDVAVQAKSLLGAAVWPGVGGERVFGKVLVSAGVDVERTKAQLRYPFCLILPGSTTPDEDSDALTTSTLTFLVVHRVAGDPWGETVLVGGAGPGTGLVSQGQGLMQIQQVLYDTLKLLTEQSGVQIQLISASAIAASLDEEIGYVASRQFEFSVWTGLGTNP